MMTNFKPTILCRTP